MQAEFQDSGNSEVGSSFVLGSVGSTSLRDLAIHIQLKHVGSSSQHSSPESVSLSDSDNSRCIDHDQQYLQPATAIIIATDLSSAASRGGTPASASSCEMPSNKFNSNPNSRAVADAHNVCEFQASQGSGGIGQWCPYLSCIYR